MCEEGRTVLCGANAYEKKYYFNQAFDRIPDSIKDELHVICVLFTEEVGGVFTIVFDEDGTILLETDAAEEDLLYDEIGSVLKAKALQEEKRELLESLELYYRLVILGNEGKGGQNDTSD